MSWCVPSASIPCGTQEAWQTGFPKRRCAVCPSSSSPCSFLLPYGLSAPAGPESFLWFLCTMLLGVLVTVAFTMLIYMLSFFTLSPDGLRIVFMSVIEFCQGAILPLPFFPDGIRQFMELLPFASMQNVPLRAYSGDLSGAALQKAILLQLFWLFALIALGRLLERFALKKVVVQGG